jgi:hypothetical protein
MTFHVHDGTATRTVTAVHVHDGTATRTVQEVWVHDGIAARKVYQVSSPPSFTPGFSGDTIYSKTSIYPTDSTARMQFNSDASISSNGSNSGAWGSPITANIGNNYYIRADYVSGTSPSGASLGTWLALSTARQWYVSRSGISGVGTTSGVVSVRIATDIGGTNVVAGPTNFTMNATVDF